MREDVKTYVPVQVTFDADGLMLPRCVAWEDGCVYEIDRVTDIRQAAARRAGGQGDRYTVRIRGQETYLFFEHSTDAGSGCIGRWFVERRVHDGAEGG